MTEMVQPLRKLIPLKKYKGSGKLVWKPEAIEIFEFCQQAISNCQELYFLEDTATPILQTDASDYSIGGYIFSKALIGAHLNWSVREKECYGIFYGMRLFEDLLNVTLTGKVLRWKLCLQDKDFYLCQVPGKEVHKGVPDALSRLCENMMPARQDKEEHQQRAVTLSALQPRQAITEDKFSRIAIGGTHL